MGFFNERVVGGWRELWDVGFVRYLFVFGVYFFSFFGFISVGVVEEGGYSCVR